MTRMLRAVTNRLNGDYSAVIYECRLCGTTFDGAREWCGRCDRREVARYEF